MCNQRKLRRNHKVKAKKRQSRTDRHIIYVVLKLGVSLQKRIAQTFFPTSLWGVSHQCWKSKLPWCRIAALSKST